MIKVLHNVGEFLHVSENWIYPQVVNVPNVESRVFCSGVLNLDIFPIPRRHLIVSPPPWEHAFGVPRFLNAVARRLGCGGAFTAFKMHLWRPRVLHAHFGTRGFESLKLKRQLNIPLVTSFYGYDAWMLPEMDTSWKVRYKELFESGDSFLVEGSAMRDRLVWLGCPPTKIKIHRIGVDLTLLKFEEKDFSRGFKVAMVGRFVEKKGMIEGLRACAIARERGVNLDVTVIGDARADDQEGQRIKSELQTLATSAELAGHVHFTGFLPLNQTRALLASHNVLLSPSRRATNGDAEGGSPVVLTEAMAMGLFCIGTCHCDIPEIIFNGRTGLLAARCDASALADVICTASLGSNKLNELTRLGRHHIERNFSLITQLNGLDELYASILRRN